MSLSATGLIDALRRATTGEYDVGGELGAGGMATVYLAHDLSLARKVAIKVMSPALVAMPGMVERFKREARTAASLSHPHIIPIYAVKQSAEIVYFVMKYVEGRSLESIVKAAGALPLPLVQTVLYQTAAALGAAHQAGVVHRDVKPPTSWWTGTAGLSSRTSASPKWQRRRASPRPAPPSARRAT